MKRTIVLLFIATLLSAVLANATTTTVTDVVDDATLTLTAEDQFIIGVTVDWCEVRIQVVGNDVTLTSGDQVTVWVYEDDLNDDELLFETTFTVTAGEVAAQLVDRTFNCSSDLSLVETPPNAEVYAEAFVNKDGCGFACVQDRPQTQNINVALADSTSPPPPPGGEQTASDTDDDATVILTASEDFIVGTTVDWCEVRIQVLGFDVAFSPGDIVTVEVFEDDLADDDLLFATTFVVTADEVANQFVDRTFNCSSDLSLVESGLVAEVYATALVDKDLCGFACVFDRPTTQNLPVNLQQPVPVSEATWGAVKALYGKQGSRP